jgi:hypothetical protein
MKQGTSSVLFGCHSVVHSVLVILSWRKVHKRWPSWWQVVCILIHDIGHWGRDYLNDVETKREHWIVGAVLAGRLFGMRGFLLVAGHDAYSGWPRSKLYKPDKYSWCLAPVWWLLSNELFEPKLRMGMGRLDAVRDFKQRTRHNIESGEFRPTHDFYLERTRGRLPE